MIGGWHRVAFTVALVVCGGVSALAVTLAVAATSSMPAGRVPAGYSNNAVAERQITAEQSTSLLRRGGAEIDRVPIDWRLLEPRPGDFRWATYDAIYQADLARGVRPLFTFAFAPSWASGSLCIGELLGSDCHAPPASAHYPDFAAAAAKVAGRYPKAAAIEIWNEPNTPYYWGGRRPDPAAYTELLKVAHPAIKAAQPTMKVAAGATASGIGSTSTGKISGPDFLGAMYEAGAKRFMEVISLHAYPATGDATMATALDPVRGARKVRRRFGDTAAPIWVTETGVRRSSSDGVDGALQAKLLRVLDATLRSAPAVEMILFHELVERHRPTSSLEQGYGVVSPSLEWWPAYCALSRAWGRNPCRR